MVKVGAERHIVPIRELVCALFPVVLPCRCCALCLSEVIEIPLVVPVYPQLLEIVYVVGIYADQRRIPVAQKVCLDGGLVVLGRLQPCGHVAVPFVHETRLDINV